MAHSERRHLVGFGLSIDSDRDVPGALSKPLTAAPDLRIATAPPQPLDDPAPPIYRWEDDTLTFSATGVGRYTCRRDAIVISAVPGADPNSVTALLIATALPAVGWLRADVMLHAAGIVAPARRAALAVAGPSGVGKSALIAQLLDRGGALLADDSIRLRRCGDGIEGSGLPCGYHLASGGGEARDFQSLPAERSLHAAPIGAVTILSRTQGPPALVRLRPIDAVTRLLANLHRPAIPATLGQRTPALTTMAFLAGNCAVYEWHRPTAALSIMESDMLAREGLW